jgi:hypothetical protein
VYTRYLVSGQSVPTAEPSKAKPLAITLPDWVIPLLVGTFVIGPFIWTVVGRKLTTAAIAKGAKVSEKKVDEWLAAA